MKNFKKIISAALCAAMVLGIASCGKTGETKHHRDDDVETEASKREGGDVTTETTEITITETEVTITESSETETQETTERPTASVPDTTFETDEDFDPDFTFSTTDRVGNEWNESVFANAEVTMINFWEPWCSPCVNEMPDLEKLYENYQDQGFQIIGVYSETGMEYEVDQILKDCHTTYPILYIRRSSTSSRQVTFPQPYSLTARVTCSTFPAATTWSLADSLTVTGKR